MGSISTVHKLSSRETGIRTRGRWVRSVNATSVLCDPQFTQSSFCRSCFVKFCDTNSVSVAQHLTNTVFIDRAIIVTPIQSGDVPDERDGLIMATQVTSRKNLCLFCPRLAQDDIARMV